MSDNSDSPTSNQGDVVDDARPAPDRSPAAHAGTIGVVLMAYGTPSSPDDIEAYYTDIRRGRPPSPEQLADLAARYEAIGGLSPLGARTEAQAHAVQRSLDDLEPGRYRVVLGLKHASPSIEDAVATLAADQVQQVVGVVLAPHYSRFSVGQYLDRLAAAAEKFDMDVAEVRSWATDSAFVRFVAADLGRRIEAMDGATKVLFTAHSLPVRILDEDDPYPDELRATAMAVAAELGLEENLDWEIAWQSAGRTPEPWIGPDILEVLDETATSADRRPDGLIVSAVGFVSDHLEVLYDLDIEARDVAEHHGFLFDRTTCVNDDASVMASLANTIDSAASNAFDLE